MIAFSYPTGLPVQTTHRRERIHSSALIADARYSRLDALSSVGAMVGLFLVALGYPIGDPIAGLAVTVLIVHVGLEGTREVLHHLLDGIEPELIDAVAAVARAAPGVEAVVRARGRWTGRVVRLELDLRLVGIGNPDSIMRRRRGTRG
jgi:divalent metal cation (Fe/Co/Zn/Cd) transporter